jgi:hypothetical protein
MNKSKVLEDLKVRFVTKTPSLIFNGQVGRRNLKILLKNSSYFKDFVKTTKATGVEPIVT